MQRIYFICPNIRKELSIISDIPEGKTPKGMYDVTCRHCGEIHRFYGKDALRTRRAAPKPKKLRLLR